MRPTTLLVLLALGALAAAGGWYYGLRPPPEPIEPAPVLAFPGLAPALRTAERVEIVHQSKTLTIARRDDVWGLADRDQFPVQPATLHALLAGLADLKLVEPRTADPAQFARLGLDDPQKPGTAATLVRVLDAGGAPIAALVLGHIGSSARSTLPKSVYVRRPDGEKTWLAEGAVPADPDPVAWMQRDIVSIDHGRLASITARRGQETLELVRDGATYTLKSPADHPPLETYKLDDSFSALEAMTLTDARPAAQVPGEPVGESVFTTTDGLRLTIRLFRAGADVWAVLAASGDGAAAPEAARIEARVHPWAYQIAAWTEKAILPGLADLKKEPPPAAPAPAAAPAP